MKKRQPTCRAHVAGLSLILAGGAAALPALAAGAPVPGSAPKTGAAPSYETQKKQLKAISASTLAEVRASGRALVGRVLELQGQVKGSFYRGGSQAVLFEFPDGELLTLEAPPSLQGSASLRPGAAPRLLVRVDGSVGSDVSLSLLNVSETAAADEILKPDDDSGAPVVLTPMTSMVGPVPGAGPAKNPNGAVNPGSPTSAGTAARDPNQRAFFASLARRYNPRLSPEAADNIAGCLLSCAASQNLDPRFLAAVVTVESSFDPYCLSTSGAMGLGQLMPFNLRGLGITNAWDPSQNLQGAACMLRNNLNRFANQPNSTLLAVAAYHAGGNAVARAGQQVPNRPATQRYVWKVYYAYKALAPELFQ